MNPIDYVILAIIVVILGSVLLYIRKAKKKGIHCIGCPDSGKCAGNCGSCGGCSCSSSTDNAEPKQ